MSATVTPLRPRTRRRRRIHPAHLRLAVMAILISLAFLGLVARLWYLQIYLGDELRQQSIVNSTRVLLTRAPRGDILDHNGLPLADSRQTLSLEVQSDFRKTNPHLLERLAPILHTTPEALAETMEEDGASPYAIRVAENLTPAMMAQIEEQRPYLGGATIQPNPIRHYPLDKAATHILGYLGMITDRELSALKRYRYRAGDYVGKGGIERQYNALLRGTDGGRAVEVDPAGRIKRVLSEIVPRPGNTLHLSIDRRVQQAALDALAAENGKRGAAVAIDPRNGQVLALVSYPTYNIRVFSTRRPPQLWKPLLDDPNRPLENRAISAQYPPASTFKPLVAATGLQSGAISPHMTVICHGGMRIGRQWKACYKYHGYVDFDRSIAESCDVFYYTAGQRMGIDQIVGGAQEFGLGKPTGIDLGPEAPGALPTKAWRDEVYKHWYPGQTANCAIGQGEIHATPLQMADAVAAIANGGRLYRPHLLVKATDWAGRTTVSVTPQLVRKLPISPSVLGRVRAAMRLAVTDGTARIINLPDIAVAGKTGTAQTIRRRANHGWLTCFAPYDSPRIAIAVIVEEGIHGADSGGPVARAMLEAFFSKRKPAAVASASTAGSPVGAPPATGRPASPQGMGAAPAAGVRGPAAPAAISASNARFGLLQGLVPKPTAAPKPSGVPPTSASPGAQPSARAGVLPTAQPGMPRRGRWRHRWRQGSQRWRRHR